MSYPIEIKYNQNNISFLMQYISSFWSTAIIILFLSSIDSNTVYKVSILNLKI